MESLCFRAPPALLGVPSPPLAAAAGFDVRPTHHHQQLPSHVCTAERSPAAGAPMETVAGQHSYMHARPLRRLWPGGGAGGGVDRASSEELKISKDREYREEETSGGDGRQRGNWVLKILRVRSVWSAEGGEIRGRSGKDGVLEKEERWVGGEESGDHRIWHGGDRCVECCEADGSEGCRVGDDEEQMGFDRESFSRLLKRVSLAEARLFAQLSYLGRLAYNIPKIKPANLLKNHGLRFVTSSLDEKSKLPNVDKVSSEDQDEKIQRREDEEESEKGKCQQKNGRPISASSVYQIAASAASYLQSQTRSILPFRSARRVVGVSSNAGGSGSEGTDLTSSEMASFVVTTNSVTAVVAAKEETKQAVAKDLNSAKSSPCEWFICDDDTSGTRLFIIQGSESLASWQANLLFEPTQFEGLDVLVHRGIYEAAKGIYQQMLPYTQEHLKSHGNSATFRFTGHSLGGSLSTLVNLMLLIKGEVPPSSLLPVITFGSPSIMCGGDFLLQKLGLPLNHVQAIMMHRDIVPRAFSCNYPDHVAEILKAVNGKFRNHPCLKHQRLLYAPMGELFILQPEEKFSPHHDLLPAGSGLYVLGHKSLNSNNPVGRLRSAQSMFLNSPHPLEILSDRAAYGPEGTVCRDHDVNVYLRSLRGVVCQELRQMRKAKRKHDHRVWWPLVVSQEIKESIVMGRRRGSGTSGPIQLTVSIVLHGGMESLRRLGKFVASRHVHMLVVLLLPARVLLLGVLRITSFS